MAYKKENMNKEKKWDYLHSRTSGQHKAKCIGKISSHHSGKWVSNPTLKAVNNTKNNMRKMCYRPRNANILTTFLSSTQQVNGVPTRTTTDNRKYV